MKDGLRVVVALAFLMGLAGCNLVVSEEPWFTAADAAPEPILRDGLWLYAKPDCRVDEAEPAEQWPDCAHAAFVRGKEHWSMRWDLADERGRHRRTFAGWESDGLVLPNALLIANGDHLIIQVPAQEAEMTEGGEPPGYSYAAMRPVGHDEQGKVIATEIWLVQCGPLSQLEPSHERRSRSRRDDDVAEDADYVTDRPFPGLTIVENNCVATTADALRNAAALSEALAPPQEGRWVREGWR